MLCQDKGAGDCDRVSPYPTVEDLLTPMASVTNIEEPGRTIPVVGEYDVLVVGGGIAGVAAGIAAARRGASVCLIERYCGLGGLATLGNVTIWLPLCDGMGNQVIAGMGEELLRLSVSGLGQEYESAQWRSVPDCWEPGGDPSQREKQRFKAWFNPASYMFALEQMAVSERVHLLYDSRFCDVQRDADRITHVIVENKDGRCGLAGKVIIDATGDADVCHAGGEQTVSLDSNVLCGWYYTLSGGVVKLHKLSNPYDAMATREKSTGPFFRGDLAEDVTQQILQTRALIRQKLAQQRAEQPDQDVQLLMPATMACFRMSRRLVGQATIQNSDVHQWTDTAIGLTGDWRRPGPVFAIPFQSMCPKRTGNLLAAGRCISVDNTAWDVLRAIPACVVTGQAAGTAAAMACATTGGRIADLCICDLQADLVEQGALIDRSLLAEHRKAAKTR